ncbi:uncharacterized protein BO95DRAFT_445585 [Aspergillus brunneoviolaceus CBS 621.78]|uniref:Uncharacterized protein n=1 Tax=Aspergillus brunneoviolaceus CBS 621.78 TaxID=1450534 RepID=A0ACD1G0X4_9EURO|nr:hypothetical protein BO95DRAFT_445585 [Aspergillus brunneoviolaceus CBS 621.78]RAH42857.1 hypothetical protein BO95DRAFT_445585 [Aspergillus brunneoviolaceus CBS 621.78]
MSPLSRFSLSLLGLLCSPRPEPHPRQWRYPRLPPQILDTCPTTPMHTTSVRSDRLMTKKLRCQKANFKVKPQSQEVTEHLNGKVNRIWQWLVSGGQTQVVSRGLQAGLGLGLQFPGLGISLT